MDLVDFAMDSGECYVVAQQVYRGVVKYGAQYYRSEQGTYCEYAGVPLLKPTGQSVVTQAETGEQSAEDQIPEEGSSAANETDAATVEDTMAEPGITEVAEGPE